jgi:hypothetical protein
MAGGLGVLLGGNWLALRVSCQFRVQGLEFRVQNSGFKVQGSGLRVAGGRWRVSRVKSEGLGFNDEGVRATRCPLTRAHVRPPRALVCTRGDTCVRSATRVYTVTRVVALKRTCLPLALPRDRVVHLHLTRWLQTLCSTLHPKNLETIKPRHPDTQGPGTEPVAFDPNP